MMLDKYRKVAEDFESIAPELEKDGLVLTISSDDDKVYPMDKDGNYTGYPTRDEIETISLEDEVDESIMPAAETAGPTTALF